MREDVWRPCSTKCKLLAQSDVCQIFGVNQCHFNKSSWYNDAAFCELHISDDYVKDAGSHSILASSCDWLRIHAVITSKGRVTGYYKNQMQNGGGSQILAQGSNTVTRSSKATVARTRAANLTQSDGFHWMYQARCHWDACQKSVQ